uniref:Ubiquitin-like domain-containing protein n=1 Tax=Noctiluca scintillans TaxID=2966 RepID=A0A7S1B2U5_NOCSC|mmetsp:Transcript_8966/g.25003  ORF Transcript_8966/g.25003 Transcript_8966/m.25003 type:complete len:331 (+) Transcript_8966:44-1036(+)
MSDGEIFPLSITDLAGTTLDLGSVRENETVATLRRRVADLWGVAVERVDLLHNSGALADVDHHRVVRDVFTVHDTLLAARQPCRARATDYPSQILRGGGFFEVCHVSFPAPKDININMMPFIFGDESSLPEECRGYWEMTQRCRPKYFGSSEDGKVCFLTIHEGMVEKGLSQRRPGVHVERSEVEVKGWPSDRHIAWGGGAPDNWEGGLYIASSVDSSTKIWSATVTPEIVGDLGSVQHIEDLLVWRHARVDDRSYSARVRRLRGIRLSTILPARDKRCDTLVRGAFHAQSSGYRSRSRDHPDRVSQQVWLFRGLTGISGFWHVPPVMQE